MTSFQKHVKEISKIVGMFTPDHEIGISKGNHIKVVIRRGDEQRMLFSGKTPSDHRALLNFKSQVRRAYEDMADDEPRF